MKVSSALKSALANTSRLSSPRWEAIRHAKPLSHFLTDNFNRTHDYLRISITERCNLRCLYCMPEEGVPLQADEKILNADEIVQLASIFVSQGVRKIRLTGGEPTIRRDIVEIVQRLGALKGVEELCLTSNGIALHRKLPKLANAGLTAVNLSLDTLIEGKFVLITRRNGLQNVMKSLETALQLGIPKVKLNVVLIKGLNDDEILKFVQLAQYYPLEIRFIEYMPFDGNKWELDKVMSFREILDVIRTEHPIIEQVKHKYGETSKVYEIPGFQGRIGFISSMTDDFCADCTRLRLTSDGNLKVCLFDNGEVSLRDMLRSNASEEEILEVIGRAVKGKKEKHADLDELPSMKNRPMTLIGNGVDQLLHTTTIHKLHPLGFTHSITGRRLYSTKRLTHVNEKGEARMVDVSDKAVTKRRATAEGYIKFSNTVPVTQILDNNNKKGDVMSIARISGISGIKKTSELIILCHPLPLTKAAVNVEILGDDSIRVTATAQCDGKTGVEMEAVTGVTTALLNVYDMCKAVDKEMEIHGVRVVEKTGGKSDYSYRP